MAAFVTTGRSRLDRAFGFGLAAASQIQLSVVNSLIRPAGLAPAWLPASPAHAQKPKLAAEKATQRGRASLVGFMVGPVSSRLLAPTAFSLCPLRSLCQFNFGCRGKPKQVRSPKADFAGQRLAAVGGDFPPGGVTPPAQGRRLDGQRRRGRSACGLVSVYWLRASGFAGLNCAPDAGRSSLSGRVEGGGEAHLLAPPFPAPQGGRA
jgi:hypothetical protein